VAEQQLDRTDIRACFQQMDGKGVAQRMWGDEFFQTGAAAGLLAGLRHRFPADRLACHLAGEEPLHRPADLPVGAQVLGFEAQWNSYGTRSITVLMESRPLWKVSWLGAVARA